MNDLRGIDCYVRDCMAIFEYGVVIIICNSLLNILSWDK